ICSTPCGVTDSKAVFSERARLESRPMTQRPGPADRLSTLSRPTRSSTTIDRTRPLPPFSKENAVMRFGACAVLVALMSLSTTSCGEKSNNPVVVMETSMGNVKIELFQDKAPITVKNFLQYVDDKFYDGTIFHRVIPDFMIQGGGFTTGMKEK